MNDFYVTLPSNVPNAPFPNTSSRYVTRLPEVLQLKRDEWMVALTDLVYPHSFVNVGKPLHYWVHFKSDRNPIRITFPAAHYKDLAQILTTLNREKHTRMKRSAVDDFIKEGISKTKREAPAVTPAPDQTEEEEDEEDIVATIDAFEAEEEERARLEAKRIQDEKDAEDKRKADEAKMQQDEAKRRQDEEQRRQAEERERLDAKRRQDEEKRQRDEAKRQKDEKDVEDKRKADEEKRRQDEAKRRQDEAKRRQDEEKRRQDETKRRQDEEKRRQDEARRQQDEVKRRQDEEKRRQDEENRRKAAEEAAKSATTVPPTTTPAPVTTPAPEQTDEDEEEDIVATIDAFEAEENASNKPSESSEDKTAEKPEETPALVPTDDEDEEDIVETIDAFEEEERKMKEAQIIDEEARLRNETEERNRRLQEEQRQREKEDEDIAMTIDEFEKAEAMYPEYKKVSLQVLNRPEDPTTYRDLLNEFDKHRSLVNVIAPQFDAKNYFNFSEEDGRLKVNITHPDVLFLEFDKGCSYFLGFDDTIVRNTMVAPHKVDLFGDVSVIYLYSDVVDPIIVGNKKTNLLSVIPCTGQHGAVVYYTVPNPRYVPLISSTIDSIRIELLTDGGNPVPFSWGTTIAVLHFKKLVLR